MTAEELMQEIRGYLALNEKERAVIEAAEAAKPELVAYNNRVAETFGATTWQTRPMEELEFAIQALEAEEA